MKDPSVFLWLVQQGDFLHKDLVAKIEWQLNHNPTLEIETNLKEAWELLLLNQNLLPHMSIESSFFIDEKMAKEGYSLEVKLLLEKVLSPYLKFYPPYSFGSDSSLYRAEIVMSDSHQKNQINRLLTTTDLQFYRDFLGILESRLATYIELTKRKPSSLAGDHYEFNWEITSILDHSQNQDFDSRPILIRLFQQCFEQLHKTETALCNQVLARWASKPEWLWHRMVLAYATQYSDVLDPAPAWQVLRQNDYIVIQKSCRIKKEFFDYIEKEGLTLPDDILQAIYAQLLLPNDKNDECTWYGDEKYNVLESLKYNRKLKLPDDLETLYQQLLSEGYSRESESYKFPHYSLGSQWMPPSDARDLIESPDEDAFVYFLDPKGTWDKDRKFEAYVKKDPEKGLALFLRLLKKDGEFSQRYLRSLDWGLSSFQHKDDSSQEKTDEEPEAEKQVRLFPLLGIYEDIFALSTLHDPSQPLNSGAEFLKNEITWLVDRGKPRVLALFETMWKRSIETLAENALSRQDYFTQVLNQPLGKLVEALLKLEQHRFRIYVAKQKKGNQTTAQQAPFTLLNETKRYLDNLMQIPNVEYTYSMLGAYLAFLFQVHQDWTQTHLFPLLQVNASHPNFQKGKALVEGLVGYGNFTLPLFNDLADSLRNLDCQAYFKAEDRNLFKLYAKTMLSTYFVHPATPTDLRRMTAVDVHAWLKQMPVENLSLVAETIKSSIVLNDESFESQLKPFFEIAWTKEKNKRTTEHTGIFIELALDNPHYCKQIADLLRRENLVIRTEAGHNRLSFLWRFEEHLNDFDQENFTAFCELLCDYLPDHCQYESHILKQYASLQ